ncbi:MAG: D-alanine--D-alanine ligase [Chthoniobacterales bacterium]
MTKRDLPKKIAVLMGGPSSERKVSLATGAGIAKALRSLGTEVAEVDVLDENFALPADVDFAFIALHGTFGEDGQVQKILEDRGLPYTGDGVKESELAFDKIRSKEKFIEHGVSTPESEIVHAGERPTMKVPLVVKPSRQGSTVGIHIVKRPDELDAALVDAAKFDRDLLIEQYIPGRELTVGILGDQALPILEIIPKGGFYDFETKYPFLNPEVGASAQHICPAKIDPATIRGEIQDLALRAFRALGLKVYGRVDVILSDKGEPFVLEVNTIPGMTEASLLPEAAAAAGISYVDLCQQIIQLSRARVKMR